MSYFKVLGFEREPFSTSPDPDFFYLSKEHEAALSNTLIELRLKRGLSVILGDVGTGKTTLSRKLITELKDRPDFVFQIILDPSFEKEELLLSALARNFDIPAGNSSNLSIPELREALERFLFQKGVGENKIITLIIDEAQKLSTASLEVLRVLLNYETNEFKLLQLVLLGQLELYSRIMDIPNFFDRISFKYTLNPLDFEETKEMIDFRVRQAGYKANIHLFLDDAIKEIHRHTRGYPRRITMLCHTALKELLLKNKFVVDPQMINEIIQREIQAGWHRSDPLLQKGPAI
ncbi:MAG: AAA family ATPase [Candidatus Omnitrophica bacterium]|nr:AAA family ATPase [Candidatus Omnitrophota bacterium]MDD5553258.1 AAA family ATPase [Candidatus Omnitrophota bacterium]